MDRIRLPLARQFTLAYLLSEVALIAIALAATRFASIPSGAEVEVRTALYCLALVASCGAAGGLCLRMAVGLVAGGVFAVASIPLLVVVISAAV